MDLSKLICDVRDKKKLFLVVTGGVCSSLGKGVLIASIGALLQTLGRAVSVMKFDPYLNVDPGTMSPLEHGEVFVTADGAETDLDLGHYERMLGLELHRDSSVSSGQVFAEIIDGERRGTYLGRCIQLVPHVVDAIKARLLAFALHHDVEVVLVEIGGTVGDIEGMVFLEALRQLKLDLGARSVFHAHLSYVPTLPWIGEIKTKPTQHSVNELKKAGLVPDALFLRCDGAIDVKARAKVALMCGIATDFVFEVPTVRPPLKLLFSLAAQRLPEMLGEFFNFDIHENFQIQQPLWSEWKQLVNNIEQAERRILVGLIIKYAGANDPYLSVIEALKSAAYAHKIILEINSIDAQKLEQQDVGEWARLRELNGIVVPGGFDKRGTEGKILALTWARENKIPCLGLCLGFQLMLVEAARSLLKLSAATSTEFEKNTPDPIISLLSEQAGIEVKGGTMRLGAYECELLPGSLAQRVYGVATVAERHRHRYEFNDAYKKRLEACGVVFSGIHKQKNLVEIAEIAGHPFMLGTQFHPEFKGSYLNPHPLFKGFIQAVINRNIE